jgi:hypothetical protein
MEGKAPIILSPGDTVLIPPNGRHWHGAAPDRMFIHLAFQENDEGGAGTQWLEHVTDAEWLTPDSRQPCYTGAGDISYIDHAGASRMLAR